MPVMECYCGMVMSVTASPAAVHCIRCGRSELKVLNAVGTSTADSATQRRKRATRPRHVAMPFLLVDDVRAALMERMVDGSHI